MTEDHEYHLNLGDSLENAISWRQSYTLWHTTNAICCFSAENLVTQAHLFTKMNFLLFHELQQLTII
jgi:hypothetical protein